MQKVAERRVELAARRRIMGFTQESLAEHVGVEQTTVKRWELGHRTPGPAVRSALAAALGLTHTQLELILRGQPSNQPPNGFPQSSPTRKPPVPEGDDPTNRRQLLTTMSAAGLSVLGSVPQAEDSALGNDAERLLGVPPLYRRLEARMSSRLLAEPVTAHLRLMQRLLDDTTIGSSDDRQLSAGISEAAGLAAWLHADMDDKHQARQYYRLAISAATRSDHPLLDAYMTASLGQFATSGGEPTQALRLFRRARSRLTGETPLASVWLDTLEGAALAEQRNPDALHLFGRAEAGLASLKHHEPVWPWLFRFDTAKLAGYRAVAAVRLNRPSLALSSFDVVMATSVSPKQRGLFDAHRATALLQQQRYAEACHAAADAFQTGRRHDSARVMHAVAHFRAELGGRYTGEEVDALDHKLHTVYALDA